MISEIMVARIRLLAGPAKEIRAESRLGEAKLYGSTCTGFPHPNPKTKSRRVPIGSKCDKGFKVSLPLALAVGSPSLSAA